MTTIEWADKSWNPLRARLAICRLCKQPFNVSTHTGSPEWKKAYTDAVQINVNGGAMPHPFAPFAEPKVGWACQKCAPECAHCYAEHMNVENGGNPGRMGTGVAYAADQNEKIEHFVHEPTLLQPLSWKSPRRIFPCSMTDLYGSWVPDNVLDLLYAVMAMTPQHTYIVLTKRPERRKRYLDELAEQDNVGTRITSAAVKLSKDNKAVVEGDWPLPNVIEMGSFGTQAEAERQAPILAATRAARIGLSCEPLLEPLELPACILADSPATLLNPGSRRLSWIIVGGESGEAARPMDVMWARSIRRQVGVQNIPFFMKQLGSNVREEGHRIKLRDRHGRDYQEFPESLQWREEPAEAILV
jgi:protein gp37